MPYPWLLNDRFNAAFGNRGLSLPTPIPTPIPEQPAPPIPAPPPVVNPNDPIRMPEQAAVDAWRAGANRDIAAGNTNLPPAPMPQAPVAPVPNLTAQDVPGQQGVTLDSNPIQSASPVTAEAAPASGKSFTDLLGDKDFMGGLDQISKGLKGKAMQDMSQITPASGALSANLGGGGGGSQAAQLMSQLMQFNRSRYGRSLMG